MARAKKREVVYPKYMTKLYTGPRAITVNKMKGFLGWCEDEGEAGGVEYDFEVEGRKVWLLNNLNNRPIYKSVYDGLRQVILRRQWRFNGEPMILSRYGGLLDGQHSGIALVLAEEERLRDIESGSFHWSENWPGPVTLEKLIVYGVDDADEVVNTINTARPRSSMDVIYRSDYFRDCPKPARRTLSQMTEACVRLLWERTGAKGNAWTPIRTHGETTDFIERHPTLLKCVRHIFECDPKAIGKYLRPGFAAAVAYLMLASGSAENGEAYFSTPTHERNESLLELLSLAERVNEFWSKFVKEEDFEVIRQAIGNLGFGATVPEKLAVVCMAWGVFQGEALATPDELEIEYVNRNGIKTPVELPSFDGIDRGSGFIPPDEDEPTEAVVPQIEVRMGEVTNGKNGPPKTPPDFKTWLEELHQYHQDSVFLHLNALGRWVAFGRSAETVGLAVDKTPRMHPRELLHVSVKGDELNTTITKLNEAGWCVGLCRVEGQKPEFPQKRGL